MAKASKAKKGDHESHVTTDHEQITRWVEERNGQPAIVKGTENGKSALLRIDYPGFTGEETLEAVSWEEFFRIFDENNLAFLYQERTADGDLSRFSKLIDCDRAE